MRFRQLAEPVSLCTWSHRRLHQALTGNGEVGYPLERLADDLETVARAGR